MDRHRVLEGKLHTFQNGRHRWSGATVNAPPHGPDRAQPVRFVASRDMRPVRTNKAMQTYSGTTAEVADLPCGIDPETTVAFFKPTVEDLERIADGGLIQLRIWGHPIPPVAVVVSDAQDGITEEWKATDLRCNDCGAIYEEKRGLDHCGHCGHILTPAVFAR